MGKLEIHQVRCALAKKRQDIHEADLQELLSRVPADDHPYRGNRSGCYNKLLKCQKFRWPSQGPKALLRAQRLYQCRPLDAFLSELEPKPNPAHLPILTRGAIIAEFSARLGASSDSKSVWVPVSELASGTYGRKATASDNPTRRLINWWTDFKLDEDRLVESLRRVGLPGDWLVGHCALLRCTVSPEIETEARIPSSLDGFASEIFFPTAYAENPAAGRAINVGAKPFRLGESEYVLGPVPVRDLELRLVEISYEDNQANDADCGNPDFLDRLEQYYRLFL